MHRHALRSRGFTLIEVLVAFAIAAVMLGALYDVFSVSVGSENAADRYRNAVLLAQSALDALSTVPISPGHSVDRIGIYERTTEIIPRPDLVPKGMLYRALPYEVEVRVSWRDGIRQRSVQLDTLRLVPVPHS